jgi:hypothetical protein
MRLATGDRIVFVSPDGSQTASGTVTGVSGDDVTLQSGLASNVGADWTAFKGMVGLIDNGKGLNWDQVSGAMSLGFSSWVEPSVQRTGASAIVNIFNSLPVLERLALADSDEELSFEREVFDNQTGLRSIAVGHDVVDVRLGRTFLVNRMTDVADVDYWALFLDTVRGSWKAFLMSTQLQDMDLVSPLSQGGTTMTVSPSEHSSLLHPHNSFKNFEVVYSDGTSSRHTITASTNGSVTFTPALPSDPKVASVSRISYLLRVRMADRLRWSHGPLKSRLSFDVQTTDDS